MKTAFPTFYAVGSGRKGLSRKAISDRLEIFPRIQAEVFRPLECSELAENLIIHTSLSAVQSADTIA